MLSLPWTHNPASWNQDWSQGLKEFCFWNWVWCLSPAHPLCINHCATVVMWDGSAVHLPTAGGVSPKSWDICTVHAYRQSTQLSQECHRWTSCGVVVWFHLYKAKKKKVCGKGDRGWEKHWKSKIKCKCCRCHLEGSLAFPVNCR